MLDKLLGYKRGAAAPAAEPPVEASAAVVAPPAPAVEAEPPAVVATEAPAPPVESATVEPATVEPATVEPATVEPATVEVAPVEASPAEAAPVESATVESATAEPATVEAEPAAEEPAAEEPATVEPAPVEPPAAAAPPVPPPQPRRPTVKPPVAPAKAAVMDKGPTTLDLDLRREDPQGTEFCDGSRWRRFVRRLSRIDQLAPLAAALSRTGFLGVEGTTIQVGLGSKIGIRQLTGLVVPALDEELVAEFGEGAKLSWSVDEAAARGPSLAEKIEVLKQDRLRALKEASEKDASVKRTLDLFPGAVIEKIVLPETVEIDDVG
jgi:hypothetical protein